jgi:ketosteroid isomerase-like protein
MPTVELPTPIARYFAAKGGSDSAAILACFAEDATVFDQGEDRELRGAAEIREWLEGTVAGYKLTSEVVSIEPQGDGHLVGVVVAGDFPGSPYKFEYGIKLVGDKIGELVIAPIGSVAR